MSKRFRKTNSEGSKDLYEKKLIYNLNTKTKTNSTGLVDFNFAEKFLYGRVSRLYVPIITSNNVSEIKNIKSSHSKNTTMALDFVVDAFEALCMQFKKHLLTNNISKGERYISEISAHSGYVSPNLLYDRHISIFIDAFRDIVKTRKLRFKDFDEFLDVLMPYIVQTTRKMPLTLPGFMKSRVCPITSTGLAINISDLLPQNDSAKMQHFYQSGNWEFYLNACQSYGFAVDRNNPSVIVADIASPHMLEFARPYGIFSTDDVLNMSFRPAHHDYIEKFKVIMFKMYSALKVKQYNVETNITPSLTKHVKVTPITYTYEDFTNQYGDKYFVNLYCKIRFMEEESGFREDEMFRLIDNTIERSEISVNKALDSFELILNKTFDYRGSLSYYKMSLDKKRE